MQYDFVIPTLSELLDRNGLILTRIVCLEQHGLQQPVFALLGGYINTILNDVLIRIDTVGTAKMLVLSILNANDGNAIRVCDYSCAIWWAANG